MKGTYPGWRITHVIFVKNIFRVLPTINSSQKIQDLLRLFFHYISRWLDARDASTQENWYANALGSRLSEDDATRTSRERWVDKLEDMKTRRMWITIHSFAGQVKVTGHGALRLCNPVDCTVSWNSSRARVLGVGEAFLLDLPNQDSKSRNPHYCSGGFWPLEAHKGSPSVKQQEVNKTIELKWST